MKVKKLVWTGEGESLFCNMGFAIGHIARARKKGRYLFGIMAHYSEHESIDAAKAFAQKMQDDMIAASIE